MKDFLDKVLNWLKDVAPTTYGVAMTVYRYMVRRINQLKTKLIAKELERKKLENEKIVREKYDGMSDRDVILDALNSKSSDGDSKGGGADSDS